MRRVLFLGQKLFGEEAWEILKAAAGTGYRVAAVCSNKSPDDVWWHSNRIFETCGEIPFIDNRARNEDLIQQAIVTHGIDTLLCVQHPWILSGKILERVAYSALNFHNAKLPDYQGYNAINHAILNGDKRFTCTAHWMTEDVDRGDCALEATFEIDPTETAISLYAKSHLAGLRLFSEVVARLNKNRTIPHRKYESTGQFYARNSIAALREIKAPLSQEAEIKSRAFFFPPFEPAFFKPGTAKLYVLPADVLTWKNVTLPGMIDSMRDNFVCEISSHQPCK